MERVARIRIVSGAAGRMVLLLSAAATLGGAAAAQAPVVAEKVEEVLLAAEAVIGGGPFAPDWESLKTHEVPAWYLDGKLGISVHWGVYSVPAFEGEQYPREMYRKGSRAYEHHRKTYGPQSELGYRDFIPKLEGEKLDPARWAGLFKAAGARFVVPVAEHSDGFAMYDSGFSEWCAARMGPKRDVIGELAEAVRAQGLVFGLSTHRAENWWWFDGGRAFDSDVRDPRYAGLYGPARPAPKDPGDPRSPSRPDAAFLDDWFARTCELIDAYRPQLVRFDGWTTHEAFRPFNRRFAAFYYNRAVEWRTDVAIDYRHEAFEEGAAVLEVERGSFEGIRPQFWQMDTSISSGSRGYVEEAQYREAGEIIDDLADVVAKNGALLLGVAPRADGSIPGPEAAVLLEIGKWLKQNGEAIYGTRPWLVFGEGPTPVPGGPRSEARRAAYTGQDVRFTTRGDTLYAILLDWPGETTVLRSLPWTRKLWFGDVATVELLGKKGSLPWQRDAQGLTVQLPDAPTGEHAYVLRIRGD